MIEKDDRKSGPKNHTQREQRRNKVYELYFEKGYTAIKIANELNVNRNTITSDIEYLSKSIAQSYSKSHINENFSKVIESLEIQKGRLILLHEKIDVEKQGIGPIIKLEKMITDVNTKIGSYYEKLVPRKKEKLVISNKQYVQVIRDIIFKENDEFGLTMERKDILKAIFLVSKKDKEFVNEIFKMMEQNGLEYFSMGPIYNILNFAANTDIITKNEQQRILDEINEEAVKYLDEFDEGLEKLYQKYGNDSSKWPSEAFLEYNMLRD